MLFVIFGLFIWASRTLFSHREADGCVNIYAQEISYKRNF